MPSMYVEPQTQRKVSLLKCKDDLEIGQFIEGFVNMVRCEPNDDTKDDMLDFLANVGRAAQNDPWPVARSFANTILHEVGQNNLGWNHQARINVKKVELIAIAKSEHQEDDKNKNACRLFNKGPKLCKHQSSHGPDKLHCCAFCLVTYDAQLSHRMMECTKRGNSLSNSRHNRYDRDYHDSYDKPNRGGYRRNKEESSDSQSKNYYHKGKVGQQS